MNKKEYMKEYRQRPENKDRLKTYQKNYQKEYFKKPNIRERRKKQQKEYYQKNKKVIDLKMKEYNKMPEIKAKRREYYQKPKSKVKAKEHRNKPKVKERIKNYNKKYRKRSKVRARVNGLNRIKFKKDVDFRIKTLIRNRFGFILRKYIKIGKVITSKTHGINYNAIISHLQPFPEDISKFHIDHIKPLCTFDLTDPKQVKQAFAPKNHQWLTIQENLRKGGRINDSKK